MIKITKKDLESHHYNWSKDVSDSGEELMCRPKRVFRAVKMNDDFELDTLDLDDKKKLFIRVIKGHKGDVIVFLASGRLVYFNQDDFKKYFDILES